LIDWRPVFNIISKNYQKGESVLVRPSYEEIVLVNITLLQTWYGLSDCEVEDRVNDSISFGCFASISLENPAPDNSVISWFRTEFTKKGLYDKLVKAINIQLGKYKIIIKIYAIVDASMIDPLLKPKGKTTYQIAVDWSEHKRTLQEQENERQAQYSLKSNIPVLKAKPDG